MPKSKIFSCEITTEQLDSMFAAKEDMKAMIGCADEASDEAWRKYVNNIEQFLKQFKRS